MKKRDKVILLVSMILILTLITISVINNNKEKAIKKEVIDKYISKVEELFSSYGINDAEINVKFIGTHTTERKYKIDKYGVEVNSSQYSELMSGERRYLAEKFEELDFPLGIGMIITPTHQKIISKGKEYEFTDTAWNQTTNINSGYNLSTNDEEKGMAWAIAKDEVKKKLKSPSTAKFPFSYNGQSIKKSTGDKYQIISYVDAENSLGATVRVNFIVEFEVSGDTYKAINVTLLE